MEQAKALAAVARLPRSRREINIITYSGLRYQSLILLDPDRGVQELIAETDVLIDGPFVKSKNDGFGFKAA